MIESASTTSTGGHNPVPSVPRSGGVRSGGGDEQIPTDDPIPSVPRSGGICSSGGDDLPSVPRSAGPNTKSSSEWW